MKYKDKLQQLVYSYPHICGYEVPTNLQNFTQKDLTEVKILQKVLRGGLFFETPCSLLRPNLIRRVSTTSGNAGNLLEFEIPSGNTGNNLEINRSS